MINYKLYHRDSGRLLTQCLTIALPKEVLHQVHEFSYGNDVVNLYRLLQRQRYYCLKVPRMLPKYKNLLALPRISRFRGDCAYVQKDIEEALFEFLVTQSVVLEWMRCYEDQEESLEFAEESQLFQKDFNQVPLRYLVKAEVTMIFKGSCETM